MSNFDRMFDIVVGHEGGFTANPADRGNWTGGVIGAGTCRGTRFGISAAAYPDLDIANLSLDAAKALYQRDYWQRIAGDRLPAALALLVFDAAINNGTGRAVRWLQQVAQVPQDGVIGRADPGRDRSGCRTTRWHRRPLRRVPRATAVLHDVAADLEDIRSRLGSSPVQAAVRGSGRGLARSIDPAAPVGSGLSGKRAQWKSRERGKIRSWRG